MPPLALIDANLLVYAHDPSDPAKQAGAIRTLDLLQASGQGRLSVQCLAELFSVLTRGTDPLMSRQEASRQVALLARAWPVLAVTPQVVLEATRGASAYRMAYWDAQIWAVARMNQVTVVLSEDFATGATLEGVTFLNPLLPDFEWSG
jgi:predicted nucleic acid-binding protein